MEEKKGIEELKEAISFGLEFGSALWLAKSDDGKLSVADLPKFLAALVALPKALVGAGEIPEEVKDLDENELLEIKDLVVAKLSHLPNAGMQWLVYANAALKLVQGILELMKAFKSGQGEM